MTRHSALEASAQYRRPSLEESRDHAIDHPTLDEWLVPEHDDCHLNLSVESPQARLKRGRLTLVVQRVPHGPSVRIKCYRGEDLFGRVTQNQNHIVRRRSVRCIHCVLEQRSAMEWK